ncbi:lipid IV(A) 3-deoxy-D-manno-octulosonic acid transferase [Carnimonas bestiolae]|uniref:lipid IV(A) 3-deoxy-D-manno-octulosonic acid transferase n=1 Tax=Carnimonas bestiolae TaxID=3402172 RepID=UPI003EDC4E06
MGRHLYNTLLYSLSPLVWKRIWREQLPRHSRAERLGWIEKANNKPVVWVHAASVGEVMTAAPVIRNLIDDNPDYQVVVTTMTATGGERVSALFGDEVSHHFVALDFPQATRRMVRRLDPELLVIVETELWPNLIHAAANHQVPIVMVNARISERSFHRYARFQILVRDMLERINWVAVKSGEDGKRFRALGMEAKRITVTGPLKYDVVVPAEAVATGKALREQIGERPVWVAASVREGEEESVLEAHQEVLEQHPNALLIIVPRHPQRFDDVALSCESRFGVLSIARRSLNERIDPAVSVYVGDTMGELIALYASADIAFVGGSLVPVGGHNLLEPAALGLPVISGPHLANITEVADEMSANGALEKVESGYELGAAINTLLAYPERRKALGSAAFEVVERNRGAAERIREHLLTMVHPLSAEAYTAQQQLAARE